MTRIHARSVRSRGTAISYFLVLISVLTTSLLTTMALTAGGGAQVTGMTIHRDQAYYAAEAGVQRAFWLLQNNNTWSASSAAPLTGNIGSASYSVTTVGGWNSPIAISSVGSIGSGPAASVVTVSAVCSPTVTVPAITLGNNFNNSGNITINGDVETKGNISTNGRLRKTGSLYAGGSISTQGSVDISGSSAPNTPNITIPTITVATVIAWAQSNNVPITTINVGNGNKQTNVSSLNFGSGGVVYYSGSAGINFKGNVTVMGSGTLIADGPISIQGGASFGTSNSPASANIVTGSTLDISGYLGIVGSVYANGSISKSGAFDITGIILGQLDLSTNGGMTITRAQPPGFDLRATGSGAGSMVLSRRRADILNGLFHIASWPGFSQRFGVIGSWLRFLFVLFEMFTICIPITTESSVILPSYLSNGTK